MTTSTGTALVLLAHGSPDPRSAQATRALAELVADRLGAPTRAAFIQHDEPDLASAARDLHREGAGALIVIPTLLSRAVHARLDVPAAVALAREAIDAPITVTAPLGADERLLEALNRRIPDGPAVLAVAGTSDPHAVADLEQLSGVWQRETGRPVAVGHVSQGTPTVADALASLERDSGRRASLASFVLFPGILPDRIHSLAGNRAVSAPLWDAPEILDVIEARVADATGRAA